MLLTQLLSKKFALKNGRISLKRFGHWFLERAIEKSIEKCYEHSQVDLIAAIILCMLLTIWGNSQIVSMAFNGILTPLPSKSTPPQIGNPPSSKIFYPPPPQSSNVWLPPSYWKWPLLHFTHIATSSKHMFIFLKRL